MSGMQVVSTSVGKKPADMTRAELENTLDDIRDVVEYLTREDASYDEKCFAEEVKATASVYGKELESRRASEAPE